VAPAPHRLGLIGRDRELDELTRALQRLALGEGAVYLLAGDTGSGKTRLADELAEHAVRTGAAVWWGRCWEGGGAPAYWPWLQVLRAGAASPQGRQALAGIGEGVQALLTLLPELAPDGAALRPDVEHARFYLFDAVRSFFAACTAQAPLVVVLDDVHAADASSLLLLQFLSRQLRTLPLLLIVTYRPQATRSSTVTTQLLGAVAREGRHLPLRGLAREDVAALLTAATGVPATDAVVGHVHEISDGNPFFVTEIARLLAESGRADDAAALGIPHGVRGALRRRLEPLDHLVVSALEAAAVIGREFDLPRLAHVTGRPGDQLLDEVGSAVEQGVLEPSRRPGRFRFVHGLMRDTLVDGLVAADRIHLHQRAAEALRCLYGDAVEEHLDDLAHHLQQAATAGHGPDAIEVTVRAAERAHTKLAFEQAAARYTEALDLAEQLGTDATRRLDLLLALGEVLARAGANAEARATFKAAVAAARSLDDPVRLARAALGSGGTSTTPTAGVVDANLVDWLSEARAALSDGDDRLRSLVTGRLAMERYYLASRDERDALTAEAVQLARRSGDRAALAAALNARHFALWGLSDSEERLAAGTEILRLASAAGDDDLALQGHTWRIVALLEQGEVMAADREIARLTRLAEARRQPYHLWNAAVLQAMRALLDGRFAAADSLARRALALGERLDLDTDGLSVGPNARMMYAVQQFNRLKEEGRLSTIDDTVRGLVQQYPTLPVWRCALAFLCCQTGELDEARTEFERLALHDFRDLPQDGNWLVAITLLAEVCAVLGDAPRAERLAELLEPHAGRVIVVAQGASCRGAVAYYLGLLAATSGRSDEALAHFGDALATHDRLGARAYAIKTRVAWARCLLSHRGDDLLARRLLVQAREAAAELGLADPVGDLDADLMTRPEHGARASCAPAPRSGARATLRRRGLVWTIGYEGVTTTLKLARGLGYLARLLSEPGVEQHALSLEQAARPRAGLAGPGSSQDLLPDLSDLDQLRERFAELRAEIDEADSFHDEERGARAQARLDALTRRLTARAGMDSGDGAASAERARVNVTRAIKAVLAKIGANDPALGRHLETSVRTGTYCVYRPDPRVPLTWDIAVAEVAEPEGTR
jgi:tetratricopeptide (TPR) repeat protein